MKKVFMIIKEHMPYTIIGVILGSLLVFPISRIHNIDDYKFFYALHPLHLFLSAYTTTSVFKIYVKGTTSFIKLFMVGYVGAIVIGTLSDSIIPYLSETILKMPYRELHIGFMEHFYFISFVSILGILLAYLKPIKKISHALHIFISSFASMFHILMASDGLMFNFKFFIGIFCFIFIAVLIPCSFGDLVFPMFFIKNKDK